MFVIAGLGNPGPTYVHHRHNIGFQVADALAARYATGPWRRRGSGLIADVMIGSVKGLVLKPQTYMNLSGQAVGEMLHFYKIPLSELFVFHDELDLAAGVVRVKCGGGDAGHNGLKSITAHCGANYWRIRLGIGHPGTREAVHNYVLGDFHRSDAQWLDVLIHHCVIAAPLLIEQEANRFSAEINQALKDVRPLPQSPLQPD